MIRRILLLGVALVFLAGCASRVEPRAPDAHLVVGLRLTPEFREDNRGLFSTKSYAWVTFQRHPLKRDIPPVEIRVEAGQGWIYRAIPVVSGFHVLRSVTVRGGGVRGAENTMMARTKNNGDGTTSVNAAYLFDVPEGSISYLGSFDIEASGIPVEIELIRDEERAREVAGKDGHDLSKFQTLERNVIRGMEKLLPTADSGS